MSAAIFLILTRGIHVAATLSVFGAALSRAFVAPPALARAAPVVQRASEAELARVLRVSILAAIGFALLMLPFQAAEMAGAANVATALAAMPDVLLHTGFGHALLGRALLLALAWPLFGSARSPFLALCTAELVGIAVALQVGMGHAAAAEDWDLPESEILHLLAAGAWLGGLLPLLLLVRRLPPGLAAIAARRFSPVGIASVIILALTALVQIFLLVGGIPGLVGTEYGRVALGKLALFLALLGLAAANRNFLTPSLAGKQGSTAQRHLLRSIGIEIGLGTAVILAAAWMATLPPGLHEQPLWPFAWRPSSEALSDPDLRGEVLQGGALLAAGLLLMAGAARYRRRRWPSLAGAALLIIIGAPHLEPLLVEAYPTSYYRSPTGFTADTIATGAALYPQDCASCHGTAGRGDGPDAAGLSIPPADLTAEHLWGHSDGELFWWLSHGMADPSGNLVMPGFADALSEDERWDLIDYIRAANAGQAATDHWTVPLRAPDITAQCSDGRQIGLADLSGQAVRIVAGGTAPSESPGLVTILLAPESADGKGCVAPSDADRLAYAVIAGRPVDALAGSQFLIDGGGWLRALWRPGDPPGWTEPKALAALARQVAGTPLQAPSGGGHIHH